MTGDVLSTTIIQIRQLTLQPEVVGMRKPADSVSSFVGLALVAALTLGAVPITLAAPQDSTALSRGMERDEKRREGWQRVSDVFEAMGVEEGSRVADIGAGTGFFTVRLAKAAGSSGRVYAVDIDKKRLKTIRKRMKKGKLTNIEVIRGETDNPHLPPNTLDAILLTNAYHHLDEYQSMLAHMRRALKLDGRMVIIDYTRLENSETPRKQSRKEQTENHEIRSELVQEDLQEAGFDIADRHDSFIRLVTLECMIVAKPSSGRE